MKCMFSFKYGNEVYEFSSERELDSFLINNANRLQLADKVGDINFSKELNKQEETLAKIKTLSKDSIKVKYDKFGNKETSLKDYKSVTKIITDTELFEEGGKPLVTGFDIEDFKLRKREQMQSLTDSATGKALYTPEEITEEIETMISNWEKLAKLGTGVHAVAEIYFNNPEIDQETLKSLIKGHKDFRDLNIEKNLPELIDYVKNIHRKLKIKHGENAKFIPEVKLRTEDNFIPIVGKIDLIVVDDKGIPHIYDFKASPVKHSDFKQVKTLTFDYQLGIYKQLMAQLGFNTNSSQLGILPIQMLDIDYDKNTFNGIDTEAIILQRNNALDETSNFNKRYFRENIEKILPVKSIPFELDVAFSENLEKFDNEIFGFQERTRVHIRSLENFLKKDIRQSNDGKYFYKDRIKEIGKEIPVYFDTREKAEESAKKYYEKLQQRTGLFTEQIVSDYTEAMSSGEFPTGKASLVRMYTRFFDPYLKKGYEVNTSLVDHNIILLTHPINKTVDVISITNNDLKQKSPLALGEKITGNLINDRLSSEYSLDATNGNIELMRAMMVVNEFMPILGKDWELQDVKVLNIYNQVMAVQSTDVLKMNFKNLIDIAKNRKKLEIENNFENGNIKITDYTQRTINHLNGIIADSRRNVKQAERFKEKIESATTINEKIVQLSAILNELTNQLVDKGKFFTDPVNRLNEDDLNMLYYIVADNIRALNEMYYIYQMEDISKWSLTSDYLSPMQLSKNKIINELNKKAIAVARSEAKSRLHPILANIKTQGSDFVNHKGAFDTSLNAFDNIIERNDDSEEPILRIKDPKFLDDQNKKYAEFFLKTLNAVRYPETNGDSDHPKAKELKESGLWYDIPLIRGGLINRGLTFETLKEEYDDIKAQTMEMFDYVSPEFASKKEQQELLFNHIINPMKMGEGDMYEDRVNLLKEHGTRYFSRDLSQVLAKYMFSNVMEEEFNKILPVIKSGLIVANSVNLFSNTQLKDMSSLMQDIMQTQVFKTQHIPKKLLGAHKNLGVLSRMTSMLTLSFNPVVFVRELFQGSYNNFSRLLTKFAGKDAPTLEHLTKAYAFVSANGPGALVNDNYLTGMGMRYNLIYSMDEMVDSHRASSSNIADALMKSGTCMIFSKIADYSNRMALFMSFVYKEGIKDAYTMKNNEISYDFNKDPRFEGVLDYIKGKSTGSPKGLAKYEMMFSEFNDRRRRVGKELLKFGDPLPDGFTESQIESIINIMNQIHGNMDSDTSAQVRNYFLGRTMLKFKTYLSSKVLNNLLKPGKYQNFEASEVYEGDPETGKPIYLKLIKNPDGTISTGYTTDYDDPDCTKQRVIKMQPRWEAGACYAFKDLFMILMDPENRSNRWKELKHDPAKMAGIQFLMADALHLLLVGLFAGLFDIPEMRENAPFSADMLKAASDISKENNPLLIASSIIDIFNPIDIQITEKVAQKTFNFLTDEDTSTIDYFARTVGAGKFTKYF